MDVGFCLLGRFAGDVGDAGRRFGQCGRLVHRGRLRLRFVVGNRLIFALRVGQRPFKFGRAGFERLDRCGELSQLFRRLLFLPAGRLCLGRGGGGRLGCRGLFTFRTLEREDVPPIGDRRLQVPIDGVGAGPRAAGHQHPQEFVRLPLGERLVLDI